MERSSTSSVKSLWSRALVPLRARLPAADFETWIQPIAPLGASEGSVELAVPNRMFAAWVEENFLDELANAWVEAAGKTARFTFRWDEGAAQGELFEIARPSSGGQPPLFMLSSAPGSSADTSPAEARGGGLVAKYEFSTFVTGPSNQFARAAAIAVTGQPGTLYNPLFVFGGVGLGKTHLVNAIGNAILDRQPAARVLFLSAETFTNRLIDSIGRNKVVEFKNRMRRVDCLILDDVQSLSGKERTQEEFFHLFNALHESGRQIILTSDKYPHELRGVEERLCSRFGWGLVADIQPADVETRVAILERKARAEGIDLPMNVASFVAERFEANIRELEGALTRLAAWASLNRCEISLSLARQLIGDAAATEPKIPSFEEIVAGVTRHYGLRPGDLEARRRTRKIADARQVAMYIMRNHAGASFLAIGEYLGGRDHSTVVHGCQAITRKSSKDARFRSLLETIVRSITCG